MRPKQQYNPLVKQKIDLFFVFKGNCNEDDRTQNTGLSSEKASLVFVCVPEISRGVVLSCRDKAGMAGWMNPQKNNPKTRNKKNVQSTYPLCVFSQD